GDFTPGEQRTFQMYGMAEAQIVQEYTRSHTPDEVAAFNKLCGRYLSNHDLYDEYHRLIGQQGLDAAQDAADKTHREAEEIQQRHAAAIAGNGASRSAGSDEAPGAAFLNNYFNNDPEIRRCLELGGGTPDDCARAGVNDMGKSAEVAVGRMVGTDVNAGHVKNGVMLVGVYRSRADLTELDLTADGQALLKKCGTLADQNHPYALRSSGGAIQVLLANQPTPIVLALRPDGSLAGPGNVAVTGQAVSGYRQGYYGCPAGTAAMNCKTTTQAVYAPAVQRCTFAQLAPQPAPRPAQRLTGDAAIFGDLLDTGSHEPVSYGLRFAGVYTSSTGLKLTFSNRWVTLDCGKAHINAPYAVENTPAGFAVRVQNPSGPFALAVAPDNTLLGSGSTTVNGRLISSFHGDDVRYTPHSETCPVGTFVAVAR
ncbi:MAG TPA: hypothetical protein VJU82_13240, partial [Acidobacteriaceae bacterium]|nr:hypothetical protein [Acidobacteriaceae bacterium]